MSAADAKQAEAAAAAADEGPASDGSGVASLAELALEQVARDISLFSNRDISLDVESVRRTGDRACGRGSIHLAFRLTIDGAADTGDGAGSGMRQGCLLVPLADAITLASFLMLKSHEDILALRRRTDLDRPLKDAMLEVCNLVGGAIDNALRWFLPSGATVRAAGCQGVRDGARPVLANPPETELVVARAKSRVDSFDPSAWVLMIPNLFDLG